MQFGNFIRESDGGIMKDSIRRARPATLPLALAILLGGVSLPSVASAQTAEERLVALERDLAEKKEEIVELEVKVQALRRDMALPGPLPTIAASESYKSDKTERCDIVAGSPDVIMKEVDAFENECLGLTGWKDYQTADLNVQLSGSTDGAAIEIVPSYTRRWGLPKKDLSPTGSYRTSYLTLKGGVRANLDPGKKTSTFADLSTFSAQPGLAGIAGIEYGLSWPKTHLAYRDAIVEALDKAREECLAHFASKPVGNLRADKEGEQRFIGMRSRSATAAACEGKELSDWMSDKDRRAAYYASITQPLWGVKATPMFFVGAEARYARPKYSYFPLVDPATTGQPLLTELPGAFPKGETTDSHRVYSLKLYAGTGFDASGTRKVSGDLSGSIAYRREFAYPADTEDQQLCANSPNFYLTCYKKNISAPYELKGWVLGGRLAFETSRFAFFPGLGIEFNVTHALDVGQWGFQVPLYFLPDDKGKSQGGVIIGCTTAGETRSGYPLEKDCRASLFIGTEFGLRKR